MWKVLLILILPFLAFSKDLLLVSVYPFYDVVKGIAGESFKVETLMPPNADYHLYEVTPEDVLKIAKAKVVFLSGIPLGGWEHKIERIALHKAVKLSEGIKIIRDNERGRNDPHLWMSPRVMKRIALNVFRKLKTMYPHKAEYLEKNYIDTVHKLRELDSQYMEVLSRCKFRVVPLSHPTLGYLARDYGLEQFSLSLGSVHGGFYPKEISKLVHLLQERGVDFFFEIYGEESKLGSILKARYGLKVYSINAKIIPTSRYRDYFSIMEHNLSVLREALRCR